MHLNTILFYSLYDYKKLRALRNGFARHFFPTLHSRAKLHKQKNIFESRAIQRSILRELHLLSFWWDLHVFASKNKSQKCYSFVQKKKFLQSYSRSGLFKIRMKTINLLYHLPKMDALYPMSIFYESRNTTPKKNSHKKRITKANNNRTLM